MTRSRTELLSEVDRILHQPNLSREDSARAEQMLALADSLTDKSELRRATTNARNVELGRVSPEVHEPTSADTEFRTYLMANDVAQVRALEREQRAGLNATTGTAGEYLAPAGFSQRVEMAMASYDQLFDACTTFTTQRGGEFFYPIVDDITSVATIIAEGITSDTSADVVFAGISFPKIPTWRSGFVPVSWELIADSAFDVEGLLAGTFGKRLARGIGAYLVGILHATAPIGKTAASGTVVTADEVIDLMDSLDADYQSGAAFLMSQQTLNALHKLKSTSGGNYVFPAAQDADGRQLLLGRKVFVSPSMGLLAQVGRPIAYGYLGGFVRRVVAGSVAVKSFPERNAINGQNTYESYLRCDGALLATATSSPIVLLEMQGGS